MNLMYFVAIWAVLAFIVAVLATYRMVVSWREDDRIHLRESEQEEISTQNAISSKLDWADRYGKALTVVTLVYGLVLAGLYLYNAFLQNSTRMS